jgi:hypothetical protein
MLTTLFNNALSYNIRVRQLLVSVRGLKLLMYEALISYNISCSAVAGDV